MGCRNEQVKRGKMSRRGCRSSEELHLCKWRKKLWLHPRLCDARRGRDNDDEVKQAHAAASAPLRRARRAGGCRAQLD